MSNKWWGSLPPTALSFYFDIHTTQMLNWHHWFGKFYTVHTCALPALWALSECTVSVTARITHTLWRRTTVTLFTLLLNSITAEKLISYMNDTNTQLGTLWTSNQVRCSWTSYTRRFAHRQHQGNYNVVGNAEHLVSFYLQPNRIYRIIAGNFWGRKLSWIDGIWDFVKKTFVDSPQTGYWLGHTHNLWTCRIV